MNISGLGSIMVSTEDAGSGGIYRENLHEGDKCVLWMIDAWCQGACSKLEWIVES